MVQITSIQTDQKEEFYELLYQQQAALLEGERHKIANLANSSALLFQQLPQVISAGYYLFEENQLILGPFQGKVSCVRIPLNKGVCGTSAYLKKNLNVPDVRDFAGYIACDEAAKSELVIPLIRENQVLGVLDIDSQIYDRFDDLDEQYLTKLVALLVKGSDF